MGWFSNDKGDAQNFWPVPSYTSGYGKLDDKDTDWACTTNHGFFTETQTWYSVLSDGSILMNQVIWSHVDLKLLSKVVPQMTFQLYNPTTKKQTWKSLSVSDFKSNGRSCSAKEFAIKHTGTADGEESYTINAQLEDVKIEMVWSKAANAPGCKYGPGPNGGYSVFGANQDWQDKNHQFVIHRFLPVLSSSGTITIGGEKVDAKGDAFFVHAIQGGMMPQKIARRWNFCYFTSGGGRPVSELGNVRAIQMEFATTDDYGFKGKGTGKIKVNIGCVYLPDQNVAMVVGQTHGSAANDADAPSPYPVTTTDVSSAEHLATKLDPATSYDAPSGLLFKWDGARVDGQGRVAASIEAHDINSGLVEKVNVLAQMPKILRSAVATLSGLQPFIYQWHNPATLQVTVGDKTVPVEGWMYSEASFISH